MVPSISVSSCSLSASRPSPAKSFLELPAEIRNKVYDYLYWFPNPVCLHFYQDPNSEQPKSIAPFMPNCTVPISLFFTCHQANAEASSVFYSRNTFLLHRKVRVATSIRPCFISAILEFVAMLGSRANLLRNVVFDTFNVCSNACHRTYLDWRTELFDPATDIIDITALLYTMWNRKLNFRIGLVDTSSVSEPRAEYWRQSPHLHRNTAVTAIIQALLQDRLNLKRNRLLVCAVAIKSDGSGGIISWGSTPHSIHNTNWPRYYPHTFTEFRATGSGTRVQHIPRPRPQLLSLPAPIWKSIMKRVVFPEEGIHMNVDADTTFPLGLPQVNKKLRAELWPTSILGNRLTLLMATKTQRSDFARFRKLRRLLRKTVTYVRQDGTARDLTLEQGQFGVDSIVLQFDLDTLVQHEHVRISILPFVMETSSTMGYKQLTVRVRCATDTVDVGITLHALRCNVAEALNAMITDGGDSERRHEPELWINGLGAVVETSARHYCTYADNGVGPVLPLPTASRFVATADGALILIRMHLKDSEYRRGGQDGVGSLFGTMDDFFPFACSAVHALRYIRWVLENYDVEEWKKKPRLR